ncbi:MAG TPA: hypothetical protein VGJ63_18360 [Micromonosporaceae bacterium]
MMTRSELIRRRRQMHRRIREVVVERRLAIYAASAAAASGARGGPGEAVVPRRAKTLPDGGASRPSGARTG